MYRYDKEIGLIYDTLAFLSVYFNELRESDTAITQDSGSGYAALKAHICQSNIIISSHLSPLFITAKGKSGSYLLDSIMESIPYSRRSLKRVVRDIRNTGYSKSRLIEYATAQADRDIIQALRDPRYPVSYEMLSRLPLPPETKLDLLYAILHYDELADDLCGTIAEIYGAISVIIERTTRDTAALLESEPVRKKLAAIGNQGKESPCDIVYSVSCMNPRHLSCQRDGALYFLVGTDIEERLETEYRYAGITPLDFAQAVNTPVKYDIFKAFTEHASLSAPDVMAMVNQSRNSVRYSISEMLDKGVITPDRIEGNTHYYKLDKEYIRHISRLLSNIAN